MRRYFALTALLAVVAAAVAFGSRLNQDRHYREALAAGERALAAGQPYAAVEQFSGALALHPGSMAAYFLRASAYRASHRDDEAVRDLREAVRLAPDALQPLIALGDLYHDAGDPARAVDYYDQAARLNDRDPRLLYKLALARYQAGAPTEAIEPLTRAIARNDSLGEAEYLLGLVYRDSGDPTRATAALEQAVKVTPTLIPAREELVDLYGAQQRPLDEMRQLQALAHLDPGVRRTTAIALAQARGNQFDAALATLHEAGGLEAASSSVQLALGRVYLARAERGSNPAAARNALAVLERALGGSARRSEGLALFGRALYLGGDALGAERLLQEAVSTSPVDAEAFSYLADAAERRSHWLDARDALLNLAALQGEAVDMADRSARWRRIGLLSVRGGEPAVAVPYLVRAVANGYEDAATLAGLAEAQWRSGQHGVALESLARARTLDAADPEVLRVYKEVRRQKAEGRSKK